MANGLTTSDFEPTSQLIAWADLAVTPWRNGGGVTRQILSRRLEDSGEWVPTTSDDWDSRLSIADVGSSGAFSSFPGMTRILTIIEGASVTLTVDGAVEKLERHRPFTFDGGAHTSAELPHGPIRDLNVIARTGRIDAQVQICLLSADDPCLVLQDQYCVLLEGNAMFRAAADDAPEVQVLPFDTVLGNAQHRSTIAGEGILAVITVSAATSASDSDSDSA